MSTTANGSSCGDIRAGVGLTTAPKFANNDAMATAETNHLMDAELAANTDAVIEHIMSKRPLAPEIAKRIHERAGRIRDEILRKHGVLEIGVSAIRKLRDSV
jgi:hypothetical protein